MVYYRDVKRNNNMRDCRINGTVARSTVLAAAIENFEFEILPADFGAPGGGTVSEERSIWRVSVACRQPKTLEIRINIQHQHQPHDSP